MPNAREPLVLSTMASIVNKLQAVITPEIPKIFDAVFDCTLDMINKNFEDYPQHRTNFYELLQAVNTHCFKAFLSIPPNQFKLVFDSIVWAFKHTMRNVADTGLNILMQVRLDRPHVLPLPARCERVGMSVSVFLTACKNTMTLVGLLSVPVVSGDHPSGVAVGFCGRVWYSWRVMMIDDEYCDDGC